MEISRKYSTKRKEITSKIIAALISALLIFISCNKSHADSSKILVHEIISADNKPEHLALAASSKGKLYLLPATFFEYTSLFSGNNKRIILAAQFDVSNFDKNTRIAFLSKSSSNTIISTNPRNISDQPPLKLNLDNVGLSQMVEALEEKLYLKEKEQIQIENNIKDLTKKIDKVASLEEILRLKLSNEKTLIINQQIQEEISRLSKLFENSKKMESAKLEMSKDANSKSISASTSSSSGNGKGVEANGDIKEGLSKYYSTLLLHISTKNRKQSAESPNTLTSEDKLRIIESYQGEKPEELAKELLELRVKRKKLEEAKGL